jgi:cytochrome oxidase Cu insertion factor (SCO1/SenC/PrrC family)
MSAQSSGQRRGRWVFVGIVAVFVVPICVAALFVLGPFKWQPENTVNYGELVSPVVELGSFNPTDSNARPLQLSNVPGDWFLVVLHDDACSPACQRLIEDAERIRVAIGRDRDRVNVATLGSNEATLFSATPHWGLADTVRFFNALNASTPSNIILPTLLILDHRLRVALIYGPMQNAQASLNDLKRLLKASAPR